MGNFGETLITFLKTPGVYVSIISMIISSIAINFHNRIPEEDREGHNLIKYGYLTSIAGLVIGLLYILYTLYIANKEAADEYGTRALNKAKEQGTRALNKAKQKTG